MDKRKLETMEAVLLFICNFTGVYWFLRLPFTYLEQYSPVTISIALSMIAYLLFKFTDFRKIAYLGAVLFLPVALSESVIGWGIEYHYKTREFVWSERHIMEIPRMLRYTLDPLRAQLTSLEVLVMALTLTAGYLLLQSVMKTIDHSNEITGRGGTPQEINQSSYEQLKLQTTFLAKTTITAAGIISASNLLNSNIRLQTPEILGISMGVLGVLSLIAVIRKILRSEA